MIYLRTGLVGAVYHFYSCPLKESSLEQVQSGQESPGAVPKQSVVETQPCPKVNSGFEYVVHLQSVDEVEQGASH